VSPASSPNAAPASCSESAPSAALRLLTPLLPSYCPVWIVGFAIFIGGGFYEHLQGGELGYFLVGLFMALPCVVYPLVCPGDADKGRPMLERCGSSQPALCSGICHAPQVCGTLRFHQQSLQVLGEVQPLDFHLWVGGQLLLDALFLHGPPRQVCGIQRILHSIQLVTCVHVHLLLELAHQ